jgi:hypothetical protein
MQGREPRPFAWLIYVPRPECDKTEMVMEPDPDESTTNGIVVPDPDESSTNGIVVEGKREGILILVHLCNLKLLLGFDSAVCTWEL